jgi:hypothetical protein
MMERYYDAHLHVASWGTHRVMFRLPRTVLPLDVAERYCVNEHGTAYKSGKHIILDLSSDDEGGDWVEGAEDALSAMVGIRAELGAGDLRPLYLAWLAAYGVWERAAVGETKSVAASKSAGQLAARSTDAIAVRNEIRPGSRSARKRAATIAGTAR